MTNIQPKNTKSKLHYNEYRVDSFRLVIDKCYFEEVNIPNDFLVIDRNTGEEVYPLKRNSIPINYKYTTIYLGAYKKVLPKQTYEKVILLFSAKASDDYFGGITKQTIYDVLQCLQDIGRLKFKDISLVYRELRVRDLDIKIDLKFPYDYSEKIVENHKNLKVYFSGNSDNIKTYNNRKTGIGLQANFRDNSSYTKPFIKFYVKSDELPQKHHDFFLTLPLDIQIEFDHNVVYRYEYTIKNKTYFDKLGISDKIADILELPQSKLQEIGKYMFDVNFGLTPKRIVKRKEMQQKDYIMATMFLALHKKGFTVYEIRDMFMLEADKVNCHSNRNIALFEKIYAYATGENMTKLSKDIDFIQDWCKQLGLS